MIQKITYDEKCVIITDLPGAPDAPKVSDVSKTSCVVSWQPPEQDGGSPVTGYWLERRTKTSTRWVRVNRDLIPDTNLSITDLVENNEYEFRVMAENKVGTGPPSTPSKPIVAKDPWGKICDLSIKTC